MRMGLVLEMSSTISSSDIGDEQVNSMEFKQLPRKIRKKAAFESDGLIVPIRNTEEFLQSLDTAPKDGIVVVMYHARFCQICARVLLKLKKLANKLSKEEKAISFVTVELSENPRLCSVQGVKKFP